MGFGAGIEAMRIKDKDMYKANKIQWLIVNAFFGAY